MDAPYRHRSTSASVGPPMPRRWTICTMLLNRPCAWRSMASEAACRSHLDGPGAIEVEWPRSLHRECGLAVELRNEGHIKGGPEGQ